MEDPTMKLDMNEQECEVLLRLIDGAISSDREELRRTHSFQWQHELHGEEEILRDMRRRIKALEGDLVIAL
jgi:hypothetical protein